VNTPVSTDTTTRRERRKEARPGELVAAAFDLFVEKGFAATRSEEVAAKAGVSKGTLFLYFPTKEDLFKAVVMEKAAAPVREGMREMDDYAGSSASLVHFMMAQWWARFGDTKASGITKLMMSEAANFPELAQFYQAQVVVPARRLICAVIQRGIDSGEFRKVDTNYAMFSILAPLLFLVMWKHSMGSMCTPDLVIDPQVYLRTQADIVVEGLLKHPPQAENTFTQATSS
jgi:TetR/AcrR family transcriptional regulator